MKISVDWRKVWRAYFKLLRYSLLIPLASLLLMIGFIWYEFDFATVIRHPESIVELALFKIKIYSVLALIVLVGMAVTDFLGALLSKDLTPVVLDGILISEMSERDVSQPTRTDVRSIKYSTVSGNTEIIPSCTASSMSCFRNTIDRQ